MTGRIASAYFLHKRTRQRAAPPSPPRPERGAVGDIIDAPRAQTAAQTTSAPTRVRGSSSRRSRADGVTLDVEHCRTRSTTSSRRSRAVERHRTPDQQRLHLRQGAWKMARRPTTTSRRRCLIHLGAGHNHSRRRRRGEASPRRPSPTATDDRRVNLMYQEGDQFEVEVKRQDERVGQDHDPEEADEDEEAQPRSRADGKHPRFGKGHRVRYSRYAEAAHVRDREAPEERERCAARAARM